ncbi:MAG TPA: PilZ domain-containing protein [Allosphingosinicella sp.]|nr:PilZ domain-containing protein [Allosphingosinicella sp.]
MDSVGGHRQPDEGSAGGAASFEAEISTTPEPKSRIAPRVDVSFGAALRQRGASGVSVHVADLSTNGFRVATHLDLQPGTDVWLRLPGLEPCHARSVWSRGNYVGCQFVRPLHPAVLDMVVRNLSR